MLSWVAIVVFKICQKVVNIWSGAPAYYQVDKCSLNAVYLVIVQYYTTYFASYCGVLIVFMGLRLIKGIKKQDIYIL